MLLQGTPLGLNVALSNASIEHRNNYKHNLFYIIILRFYLVSAKP